MTEKNDKWRKERIKDGLERGEFVINKGLVVCSTCGGNCGQCGNTGILGNIGFDMNVLVKSVNQGPMRYKNPGDVARLWTWFNRPFQWRP